MVKTAILFLTPFAILAVVLVKAAVAGGNWANSVINGANNLIGVLVR